MENKSQYEAVEQFNTKKILIGAFGLGRFDCASQVLDFLLAQKKIINKKLK